MHGFWVGEGALHGVVFYLGICWSFLVCICLELGKWSLAALNGRSLKLTARSRLSANNPTIELKYHYGTFQVTSASFLR
jgi:hypothetical protein